jgi:hypothetical protein
MDKPTVDLRGITAREEIERRVRLALYRYGLDGEVEIFDERLKRMPRSIDALFQLLRQYVEPEVKL